MDSLAECPICFTVKRQKKYFSCKVGHSVCEDCLPALNKTCPSCGSGYLDPPARNFIVEELIESSKDLKLECMHDQCSFVATREILTEHEQSKCPERVLSCCNNTFPAKMLLQHVKNVHKFKCSNCDFAGTEEIVLRHSERFCLAGRGKPNIIRKPTVAPPGIPGNKKMIKPTVDPPPRPLTRPTSQPPLIPSEINITRLLKLTLSSKNSSIE